MRKFRVAVIGDFMTDKYWIGKAERISPEAPIPVVKIEEVKEFPGGAGNVAANLEALGCEVIWFDNPWKPQPIKNRLMVGDHQLARWDENDVCWPYDSTICLNNSNFDAIVVADYGKGGIDKRTIDYISSIKQTPIFVDTKRDPSCCSGVATAVFPNEKELNEFCDQYMNLNSLVICKRGAKGLELFGEDIRSAAQARFVRSVNGAGDTVIAAFVYKYLQQQLTPKDAGLMECLDFANAAAAVAVEHPYTYAPTLKEVESRFYES